MAHSFSRDLPDWNDLRDVLTIHEAGSLSAAARISGVSQSTMSRRLAAIEAGGRRVFDRGELGEVTLTERGAAMVGAARAMRLAYDQLGLALGATVQPLRIAACETTAQLFMADSLPEWGRRGNDPTDLAVYEDLFVLSPADYDVLVTPAEGAPEGTEGLEIGRIGWGLFASPEYLDRNPVRPGANSLDGHRVIRGSGSLAEVSSYRWFAGQGGNVAMLSSSPIAQLEACARGQGVALLPLALAEADPRLARLDLPACPDSPVWLYADAREASHPRIAAFLRWARGRFRRPE
ncbi:LysR family transcriptional regulator [Ostreiculturibacter nitratireducens]|uniref:LysR family transcriptional regulator n=1 Tax=Ostreiculturibacter nitratireducens TaxID=3075226 RepID=UPI0031B5816D